MAYNRNYQYQPRAGSSNYSEQSQQLQNQEKPFRQRFQNDPVTDQAIDKCKTTMRLLTYQLSEKMKGQTFVAFHEKRKENKEYQKLLNDFQNIRAEVLALRPQTIRYVNSAFWWGITCTDKKVSFGICRTSSKFTCLKDVSIWFTNLTTFVTSYINEATAVNYDFDSASEDENQAGTLPRETKTQEEEKVPSTAKVTAPKKSPKKEEKPKETPKKEDAGSTTEQDPPASEKVTETPEERQKRELDAAQEEHDGDDGLGEESDHD